MVTYEIIRLDSTKANPINRQSKETVLWYIAFFLCFQCAPLATSHCIIIIIIITIVHAMNDMQFMIRIVRLAFSFRFYLHYLIYQYCNGSLYPLTHKQMWNITCKKQQKNVNQLKFALYPRAANDSAMGKEKQTNRNSLVSLLLSFFSR